MEHPASDPSGARRLAIHATNAWNPTGRDLLPVPGCRLYYTRAEGVAGRRTQVFLGTQQHLTFVADLEGDVPSEDLRGILLSAYGLYPHLVDLDPAPGLPRVFSEQHGA